MTDVDIQTSSKDEYCFELGFIDDVRDLLCRGGYFMSIYRFFGGGDANVAHVERRVMCSEVPPAICFAAKKADLAIFAGLHQNRYLQFIINFPNETQCEHRSQQI